MNVIAVIGSPHKDGPSARLTLAAVQGARDAGHDVEVYYVEDMNIRGCQGCEFCKKNSKDCILNDDLKAYWEKLHAADGLIVSAPNYCATICGPMITYMNRHYCLLDKDWNVRIHPGIKVLGIFSQGDPDKEKFMDAYRWFMADFENRDMLLQDIIVHSRRGDGEVTPECELYKRAYEAGKSF